MIKRFFENLRLRLVHRGFLTLNEKLLRVLVAMKTREELAIIETNIEGFSKSWLNALSKYFYALPESAVEQLGLIRNDNCMDAIRELIIPAEWVNADVKELSKFTFEF